MIIFNKVSKKFSDGTIILDDVSLSIDKGEFVFLTGPSGAGKTTISRLLLKEIAPTKGRIFIDNEEITKIKKNKIPFLRRKIGTAFQDFKLFLNRTVFENISLPLEITRQKDTDIKDKVSKILSLVGLDGKEDFFPVQLSGGEVQRVVIARALIGSPKILFADEPTGNLDFDTAWGIIDLLKRINEKGMTVIVSTHNIGIVKSFNKRIIHLEKGRIKKKTSKSSESEGKSSKSEVKENKSSKLKDKDNKDSKVSKLEDKLSELEDKTSPVKKDKKNKKTKKKKEKNV